MSVCTKRNEEMYMFWTCPTLQSSLILNGNLVDLGRISCMYSFLTKFEYCLLISVIINFIGTHSMKKKKISLKNLVMYMFNKYCTELCTSEI